MTRAGGVAVVAALVSACTGQVGADAGTEVDAGTEFDAGLDAGASDAGADFAAGQSDAGFDAGDRTPEDCDPPGQVQWHPVLCPQCGGARRGGWDVDRQLGVWRFDGGALITDAPGYVVVDDSLAAVSGGSWEADGGGFSAYLAVARRRNGLDVLLMEREFDPPTRPLSIQRIDERGNPVGQPNPLVPPPDASVTAATFQQILVEGPSLGVLVALGGTPAMGPTATRNYRLNDDGGWTLMHESPSSRTMVFSGEHALTRDFVFGSQRQLFLEHAPDGGIRTVDAGFGTPAALMGHFVMAIGAEALAWRPGEIERGRTFAPFDAGFSWRSQHQGPFDRPVALASRRGSTMPPQYVVDWDRASVLDIGEPFQAVERWGPGSLVVARRAPTPGVVLIGRVCSP